MRCPCPWAIDTPFREHVRTFPKPGEPAELAFHVRKLVEDVKRDEIDPAFTQGVKDISGIHIVDRSGDGMVGIFRVYHVDHLTECVIKIAISIIERESQLVADTPCEQG